MLRQLIINNYAIVDHLDIDLKPGMTVITGETGAGKSIMLDALGLALGDRGDKDVIRSGAERADISACFELKGQQDVTDWLKTHDFSSEDGDTECILRRVITLEGRSRAYINGQPTTLNELKDLGDMLIDIHSQHEHQSLLKPKTHQRLLDAFCQQQDLAGQVSKTAAAWRSLGQQLQQLRSRADADASKLQLLTYQMQELDELALGEQELETLEREQKQLSHAEAALATSQQVLDLCRENDEHNLQRTLNQALALLDDIPYADAHIETVGSLLNTALIQVEEASTELAHAIDRFDLNPAHLEAVDQRLHDIHQLARKHRVSPRELGELQQHLKNELAGMAQADEKIEDIEKQLAALLDSYHRDAHRLSLARAEGGKRLEQDVNAQLAKLGMSGARFLLALNTPPAPSAQDAPQAQGYENIEFLVSTNPGQPPKPLVKVASGGELSRISLAIQVVTAQTSAIPSLVFDEVDVGIGGGVARAVGELLRQLGERGQVLCVTHQPQVASQGHQHLHVSKRSDQHSTLTRIVELEPQARVEEVARMLGGNELTDQSVAHAREMMV
ncbi:MAG: DNA repair protein RecN [Pseudomonadales bacterium]|nr:DNA repair protein RecN [Pseudomonadales bacterium]